MIINCSICLSDIPREKIKQSKGGKLYLPITIQDLKVSPDQYGNTHSVFISTTKEEREQGVKRCYLGNGKAIEFGTRTNVEEISAMAPVYEVDDLPDFLR